MYSAQFGFSCTVNIQPNAFEKILYNELYLRNIYFRRYLENIFRIYTRKTILDMYTTTGLI